VVIEAEPGPALVWRELLGQRAGPGRRGEERVEIPAGVVGSDQAAMPA